MIEIEQRCLSAFEQDRLAVAEQSVQVRCRIDDERTKTFTQLRIGRTDGPGIDFSELPRACSIWFFRSTWSKILRPRVSASSRSQMRRPRRPALSSYAGPMPLRGGSQFPFAELLFGGRFQHAMIGKYDVTSVETKSRPEMSTPVASMESVSSKKATGSRTTPPPTTHFTPA